MYPDHPTPWKGKPSSFFIVHETRRGTVKILNNSQKEFIIVYYPENVVDEVSLMEFLFKQAKDNEDTERWAKEANERDAATVRERTKTKKKNRVARPQYVEQIAHVNRENSNFMMRDDKPMSFERLLNAKGYSGPDE